MKKLEAINKLNKIATERCNNLEAGKYYKTKMLILMQLSQDIHDIIGGRKEGTFLGIDRKSYLVLQRISESESLEDFADKLNKQIEEDGDILGHDDLL